ncbi:MAG: hypothetical protein WA160_07905 [Pseudobdellovibrio sp.]
MIKYTLILLLLFSLSCAKKDPHPELRDEIYSDLVIEQSLMSKNIEEIEKEIIERQKILNSATPQTGQYKSFETKVFESKNNLERLRQQKQYFEIRMQQRIQEDLVKYEASLHGGKPWPDKDEIMLYKSKLKMYRDKIAWDKTGGVVKKVPRGTKTDSAVKTEERKPEH